MTEYVPADMRRRVAARAFQRCEYCLILEKNTYLGCQIDHIISEKHGGLTMEENLAFACTFCNRAKGSDIGSIAGEVSTFIRFFNPRMDAWSDHFAWIGARIEPLTLIGEATARIFGFNTTERIIEREAIFACEGYPGGAKRTE